MAYVIGIVLALTVSTYATALRLDGDRALYPTVLIVITAVRNVMEWYAGRNAAGDLYQKVGLVL